MAMVFQVMLLALGIFSNAFATAIDGIDGTYQRNEIKTRLLRDGWTSSIMWIDQGRSLVVKLDTPGCPLYIMNKTTAPPYERDSADYYYPIDELSAVLLNITLSPDNKNLFLNHRQILPLLDTSIPPRIEAYQVPANTPVSRIQDLISYGLLAQRFYGMTISLRYLGLDYDRLVWADPATGPYQNHVPTLKFRIMGMGAYAGGDSTKDSTILDMATQQVLHITLADQKHGSSDAPDRSYLITDVKFKTYRESYPYTSGPTPNNETYLDTCSSTSWRCPDKDMWIEGAPWYRYIWWHKFDQYGRVGSLRHRLAQHWSEVSRFFHDTWQIWLTSFASAFAAGILAYGTYRFVRFYLRLRAQRIEQIMHVAEQDRLLDGNKDEDEEANVGDSPNWKARNDGEGPDAPPSYDACIKPLLPSPRTSQEVNHHIENHPEPDLIVLDETERDDEDAYEPFQSNVGTV